METLERACACGAALPALGGVGKPRKWCDDCGEHGARKQTKRAVSSRVDQGTDLKMAAHTLSQTIEKLTALTAALGRNEMQALRIDLESDLGLVLRTIEGVARRGGK